MAADFTFGSINPISIPQPQEVVRNLGGPFAQTVDQDMIVIATSFPTRLNIVNLGGGTGGGSSRPTSGFLYPRGQG